MRISSSSKATALLLLVSLQYSFAVVDVALCSTALCYPKTTGAKYGKVTKKCPEGFELQANPLKAVCVKKVAKPCPAGTTLKDGKCCGSAAVTKSCSDLSGSSCPPGTTASKECGHPFLSQPGRKLLGDNPLVKEVNVVGTTIVPNVILPKPAFSLNIAPPKAREQPKINIPSMQIPQIILPEPAITFSQPTIPRFGPEIKFEGNPNIMPNIVPILPEPLITVEMPKGGFPTGGPKFTTDLNQKVVTYDFSKVGPSHAVELNLPSIPDVIGEITKLPDIDVHLPDVPKVVDLSSLGPKTSLDIKLPEVKLPKQGSLTVVNSGANEPQYLDLTGFGPKNQTGYNIKLPEFKTNGATINVILDDGNMHDVVLPGNGGKHTTVINVPDFKETPTKSSKLVVSVAANTTAAMADLEKVKKNVTKISVAMPDIDLSKSLPAGPDVVVDIKPLLAFNKSLEVKPEPKEVKRIDIQMDTITIPKILNDTTFLIQPRPINISGIAGLLHKAGLPGFNLTEDKGNATTTVINLPQEMMPSLPIPEGKTNFAVNLPLKFGLIKNLNGSAAPDAVIDVMYTEEWSGGNATLPNPGAKVVNLLGSVINNITTASCPTKCCKEVPAIELCKPQEFTLETAPVALECEKGCTYDLKSDACLCSPGSVSECPAGLTKCSIASKGVCVPDLPGHVGLDACSALKEVCGKPEVGIFAKTCLH